MVGAEDLNFADPQIVVRLAPLLSALKSHEGYAALIALSERLTRTVADTGIRGPVADHEFSRGKVAGLELLIQAVDAVIHAAVVVQKQQAEQREQEAEDRKREKAAGKSPIENAFYGGTL